MSSVIHAVQERPAKEYAVLADNSDLIGYIHVRGYGSPDPEPEVEVVPKFRQHDCGRKLLRRVIQEAFQSTDARKIVYCAGPTIPPASASLNPWEACCRCRPLWRGNCCCSIG